MPNLGAVIVEIIKSIFLKDALKKVFSFKLIRDAFISLACISAIVVFFYSFKLQEYIKTGSEHFRYSGFISSKIKPKIDNTIDELFKGAKKNSYLFISLVEVSFDGNYCSYRWKYIKGFNEGTKKTFDQIKGSNGVYRDDIAWPCSSFDSQERLVKLSNSKIRVDMGDSDENLLFTQKKWLDEERSNYKINYLTYFIKPYKSQNEFYIIQIASRKPLKKILKINIFDVKFQSLIKELNKITEPKKWYEIFNR
tara:strand:- start:195 stop:950 length:756 start_codon:yes stop_codon:yes gene_type:complete